MSENPEKHIKETKEKYVHLMQQMQYVSPQEQGYIRHKITDLSKKLFELLLQYGDKKGNHKSDESTSP